jgi:NitT/TauT family transport system permease protein
MSAVAADAADIAGTASPAESVTRRSTGRRVTQRARRWAVRVLSLAAALLAWQLLTANDVELWLRFSNIPEPGDVLTRFQDELSGGDLVSHIGSSGRRILEGFGLAALVGVATGAAIGRSRWAYDLVGPLVEVVRPIPAIAWVPMAILLFPDGEQGIVFITFLAALFPVIVATRHAVHALPLVWEDAVRTMGGGRRTVLWRVVLPGALPGIFSGLSVAMGVAWICVVSAEMISGQRGVGYFTWMSYGLIDYPGVIVGMITIGVLGLVSAAVVELVGRLATSWLPRSEVKR